MVVLTSLLLAAAGADAANTIGPFELTGGGPAAIQVPALLSVSQEIGHPTGSAAYGSGGRGAPRSVSELTITKKVDQTSSALLKQAVLTGKHWKTGTLILQKAGSGPYEALCLTDPFAISYQAGGFTGASDVPTETLKFGSAKLTVEFGAGANCSGVPAPPVESSLVRLNRSASKLTARVDCLIAHCKGILAVSLPNSACPKVASPSTFGSGGRGSQCSFTGGVRVGLTGSGKVSFNGDGTAITGGVKIGLGGAGKFSMGDGSVRVLSLTVPPPLGKWLKGHSHAVLGSIIVVRGVGKAIVQRELVGAPAKLDASVPSLIATEPGNEVPPPTPQSLALTDCSTPVVGTPTVVSVDGTLSPARGGATVTLTYTPTNGPMPLPSPVVDFVTTTATGNFGENFDRRRESKDYSWNVIASIPAGDGYAAASSPACAVPIP